MIQISVNSGPLIEISPILYEGQSRDATFEELTEYIKNSIAEGVAVHGNYDVYKDGILIGSIIP